MYAYELLPKLKYLTLTIDNTEESWEDKLEFVGTKTNWELAEKYQNILMNK